MTNSPKPLLSDALRQKRDRLLELVRACGSCAVAFSGGLDSSVLAKAAVSVLGRQAVAFTATSPSMPEGELEAAIRLARAIGIRHEVIRTDELSDPRYQANTPERCYFCKQTICRRIAERADELGLAVVVDGANADDRLDHRPGSRAARELGVRSLLAQCDLGKEELRELARHWQLSTHDKPASPCLASRIAYGVPISEARLAMVDRAEQFLRQRGFPIVRVRLHASELARVEVPVEEINRLLDRKLRGELAAHLHACGFRYVTVDLEGYRPGSLSEGLDL